MLNQFKLVFSFLLLAFISVNTFSQNNAEGLIYISGVVTHSNIPLENVSVQIQNSRKGVKTDEYGEYEITAKKGDVLVFSHLGYTSLTVTVDSKKNINIEMIPESYVLEEVLIKKAKKKAKTLEVHRKPFQTSMGIINPRTAPYRVSHISGEVINRSISIMSALQSRIPGFSIKRNNLGEESGYLRRMPVIWDIDGVVLFNEPFISMSDVKEVHVLNSAQATLRYGNRCRGTGGQGSIAACGGVIVVTLKKGVERKKTAKEEKNINQVLSNIKGNSDYVTSAENNYFETIENINNTNKAFEYCKKVLGKNKKIYNIDLRLMNNFYDNYNNKNLYLNLVDIYTNKYSKNQVAKESLAANLESRKLAKEYLKVYKKLYLEGDRTTKKIRNVANAFIDNKEYQKAWKLYASYVKKNKDFLKKPIDKVIFSDMEWLYLIQEKNIVPNIKFVPKHKNEEDFAKDLRLVVEWNNPDIDFQLNFKNSQNKNIQFKYEAKREEIKNQSFLIEEFFLQDLKKDKWNMGFTYFGNKNTSPTNFKVTYYYNWGKPNQTKEVKIFTLQGKYANRNFESL